MIRLVPAYCGKLLLLLCIFVSSVHCPMGQWYGAVHPSVYRHLISVHHLASSEHDNSQFSLYGFSPVLWQAAIFMYKVRTTTRTDTDGLHPFCFNHNSLFPATPDTNEENFQTHWSQSPFFSQIHYSRG